MPRASGVDRRRLRQLTGGRPLIAGWLHPSAFCHHPISPMARSASNAWHAAGGFKIYHTAAAAFACATSAAKEYRTRSTRGGHHATDLESVDWCAAAQPVGAVSLALCRWLLNGKQLSYIPLNDVCLCRGGNASRNPSPLSARVPRQSIGGHRHIARRRSSWYRWSGSRTLVSQA